VSIVIYLRSSKEEGALFHLCCGKSDLAEEKEISTKNTKKLSTIHLPHSAVAVADLDVGDATLTLALVHCHVVNICFKIYISK
jgi:hypothetical protein